MKSKILFLCIITVSVSFLISQSPEDITTKLKTNLKGNSTTNITNDEMRFINNAIANAQKLFNSTQLSQIAKSVSTSLATVTQSPWSVFVYDRFTQDIGLSVAAYQNKTAILIQAGNYKLSYAIIQWSSARCKHLDKTLSINSTQHRQYYGVATLPNQVQAIRQTVSSSAIYAGEELDLAAKYIRDKLTKLRNTNWGGIVSRPVAQSGTYFCPYNQDWGMLIGYGDFKYSYLVFQPNY